MHYDVASNVCPPLARVDSGAMVRMSEADVIAAMSKGKGEGGSMKAERAAKQPNGGGRGKGGGREAGVKKPGSVGVGVGRAWQIVLATSKDAI